MASRNACRLCWLAGGVTRRKRKAKRSIGRSFAPCDRGHTRWAAWPLRAGGRARVTLARFPAAIELPRSKACSSAKHGTIQCMGRKWSAPRAGLSQPPVTG